MAYLPYPIILASSSPHRRELMERLHIPFTHASPEVAEERLAGESPDAMVLRLAIDKAEAIATQHPDAIVIGADEIALCGGEILGKPGDDNALLQFGRKARVDRPGQVDPAKRVKGRTHWSLPS